MLQRCASTHLEWPGLRWEHDEAQGPKQQATTTDGHDSNERRTTPARRAQPQQDRQNPDNRIESDPKPGGPMNSLAHVLKCDTLTKQCQQHTQKRPNHIGLKQTCARLNCQCLDKIKHSGTIFAPFGLVLAPKSHSDYIWHHFSTI